MKKCLLFCLFGLMMSVMQAQDVVTMTNGQVFEGEIVRDGFGTLTVTVDKGDHQETFQLFKHSVKSIKYDHFHRKITCSILFGRSMVGARNTFGDLLFRNGYTQAFGYSIYNRRPLMGADVGYLFIPENELGIMLMNQDHFGGSAYAETGSLQFYFNNFTFLPYYKKFFWDHRLSIRAGLSFSNFRFRADDNYFYYGRNAAEITNHFMPGIFLGTSIAILERKTTTLRVMASYHQAFGKLKVDKVVGQDFNGNTFVLLEKDEFGVNQFSMALVFGVKFRGIK